MVSWTYWAFLVVIAALGIAMRLGYGQPLLRRRAVRVAPLELALAVAALIALGFHCAAMFFPSFVDAIPGMQAPAEAIRRLGAASQAAYWIPATLLIVALRRAWWLAVIAETAALLAVGVTMYGSFTLAVHLVAIAAVVALTVAVAVVLLAPVPSRTRPAH